VALFFAVSNDYDHAGEVVIWNFNKDDYNPQLAPAQVSTVKLFRPRPAFLRLRVQEGLMSYHPTITTQIDSEQILRFNIPAEIKSELQEQLHRFGINHETIYASLDHLAQKINWLSTNQIAKSERFRNLLIPPLQ
jgi:hypothetical protein